ncbi:MAG TPA: NAD(P)H-hydrate epimerase [Sedimentisphaerales bacterium]|jgi:NAD(P)H-hydrate epimerase|nr:NAD(P)H-hydrate epimerase [Sedimentisphaerales bacterium]HNU31518.1 NAD(P)H-hydrate epimerase [Sedimentisphaerales bacterium]
MERYTPEKRFRVMTREEVRAVDAWAIHEIGVPGVVLMENAGRSCAELAMQKLASVADPSVCVFCGVGNNGGDGYVIARHLLNAGIRTRTVLCGDPAKVQGDARINLGILERLGRPVDHVDPSGPDALARIQAFGRDASLIVDALFGTGLRGELRPEYRALIEAINALRRPILAVDIPSGLDCDTGQPLGTAIRAAYTVTFVAVKKGFLAPSAGGYTGELHVASIGVEPAC